ncbi:hypothetical protein Tco_0605520 [Tanacetum coccineum]
MFRLDGVMAKSPYKSTSHHGESYAAPPNSRVSWSVSGEPLTTGRDESVLSTHAYIRKIAEDVGEDEDFKGGSWVSIVEFVNANGGIVNGCLGDIKNYLKNRKLDQVVKIIKSCTSNAFGDLIVTLKDLSVPENGCGVGDSEMLDEEEIIKMLEE